MKILIFAGGTGKRLWPLSTAETPKQFVPLINNKSTFQMMIEMVEPIYGRNNIYVGSRLV